MSFFFSPAGNPDFHLLQDIAELEKLEVLTSLSELSLVDNPVSIGSLCEVKPVLIKCTNDQVSRGTRVQFPTSMI